MKLESHMKFSRFFPVIASLALAATPASAATIFFDTFTDGGRTNGADAQDVAWYETSTAVNSSIISSGGGELTGNTLSVDTVNSFQGVTAPFSMTTLSVGQTLTVTLDLRLVSATNLSNGIRIGFSNSNSNVYTADGVPNTGTAAAFTHFGYFTGVGTNTDNGVNVQQDAGTDDTAGFSNGAGISAIGTAVSTGGFDNNTNRSILFSITRTATGASLNSQVFGAVGSTGTPISQVIQEDTTSPYFSFDQLSVRIGNSGSVDYNIDNVLVTVVPEPGAALLGGLGMLMLLRRRRA